MFFQKSVKTEVSAETEATIVLGTQKCSGYMGSNPFWVLFGVFVQKLVKTAVLEDGRRPGALVLTKLVE